MLRLGELLDQSSFGLQLLTGGDDARDRSIEGAHNSEMPGPTQFLPQGWMMLTLGLQLRGRVSAQRELIAELDDGKLSALGFGVGGAFESVPRPLLNEAEKRGFPVVAIPHATPYREIIGFVNRSLLSTDLRLVQRSLSMQNYLMDALRDEHPLDALAMRLGELLDSTIILFSEQGSVVAASRDAPFDAIWDEVSKAKHPSVQRALIEGADTIAIPIESSGQTRRWLVVASRRRSLPRQLVLSVIQTTERLLDLIATSRRAAIAEERILRAEVLIAALIPTPSQDLMELRARMTGFGLCFDDSSRIMVVEPVDGKGGAVERTRIALERTLREREVPYLSAVREGRILVFAQASSQEFAEVADSLDAAEPAGVRVGGGRETRELSELPRSWRDADVAIRNLELRGKTGLLLFEQFDILSWLVGITPADDLQAKADLVLEPLRPHPELLETIAEFLRQNMRTGDTAQAMNLHENSLRYRLTRIETLLGRPLRDLATLVDLYVATLTYDGVDRPASN